jgi:asparagine N-glycosylation enzyme membrane subunit Stt3
VTAAIDTNLVVLDVVTRWRIDAALFLVAAAGFLAANVAEGHAKGAVLAFVVEAAISVLIERWTSLLPSAARLAGADPLPAGAQHGSPLRYAVAGAGRMLLVSAVTGGVALALGGGSFVGGLFGAYAIVHLIGAARARRIERRDRVGLRVGIGRRSRGYYVTSPALWGAPAG